MKKICDSILEAIGNTPLVRLNRVTEGLEAEVLVKCEYMNPSGSIKDRIALRMIRHAEETGKLKKGSKVVEASTGNTAIALSMVSAVRGYKALMCMPKGWATVERTRTMRAYGAEVQEVEPGEEIERELKGKSVHGGVVELLPRIRCLEMETHEPATWWARQALNPENIAANRDTTGKEILEQTGGKVDAFVASVGTGGTLLGVAEALLAVNPGVKIYAVEPASSSLFKMAPELRPYMEKYGIPGIAGWIITQLEERKILAEAYLVEDPEAVEMTNRLAREEGLFCGISGGANVHIALKVAQQMGKGKTVVTVLPDNRYRYFGNEHYTT
ncbi:MAG: cysteine synthase family protein [Syntrophaceae bacterium]|nr:cysteine synthase family protein [Syntrophaceae bacterium]